MRSIVDAGDEATHSGCPVVIAKADYFHLSVDEKLQLFFSQVNSNAEAVVEVEGIRGRRVVRATVVAEQLLVVVDALGSLLGVILTSSSHCRLS